ncbi:MAG: LLM class flavin-dependent oxidoreductase [Chloroflexi bacterium]|nr:LLM class flavin-dependent oxidoreductase [Chloroflexota bacterium]
MKFGVFMAPLHHRVDENPTLSMHEDLEFLEILDRLDFDEAWIGEHHSGAVEIFASPEIMIAAAAQRTRRIMLGSGVIDLPLHHPFMVADRMLMLDHITRGRAMLGVGSGALRADFRMLGIDPDLKSRMTDEALEAIIALLRGEAPVTRKTDWFELNEARLQMASYTAPHLPIGVAGSASADGSMAAGRYGLIQMSPARSPEVLDAAWTRVEETAARCGTPVHRRNFRAMKFIHVAETRQQALDDCRARMPTFTGLPLMGVSLNGTDRSRLPELSVEAGGSIIGTPDDAIEAIEALLDGSGGFGGVLLAMYGVVERQRMIRSFELFARHVMPRFQRSYSTMRANREWVVATNGGPIAQRL